MAFDLNNGIPVAYRSQSFHLVIGNLHQLFSELVVHVHEV